MIFSNPEALWLLLGIPLLIIIYLIKSKHDDRVVSSSYIWKLSRQFAKKRLPIQRIRKILMFLLQLAMIALAAFIAARPTVEDGKSKDFVVIIDASAGMNVADSDGVTRFERAIDEAEVYAKKASGGHTFTLILAKDEPVCLVNRAENGEEAKIALDRAECYLGGADMDKTIALAEEVCAQLSNPTVIMYTDHKYETTNNITVKDLSNDEWNVSMISLRSTSDKKGTRFIGQVVSYNRDTEITIGLRVDGKSIDAKVVKCLDDKPSTFEFFVENLFDYTVAEVYHEEKDGMQEDNSYANCPVKKDYNKVLLVSSTPFYLEMVLKSIDICKFDVMTSLDAPEGLSGYDLYIFDGQFPEKYPTDGSIILFGKDNLPDGLTAVSTGGGSFRIKVNHDIDSPIINNVNFEDTVVKDYYGLIGDGRWQSLMKCNGKTVMATTKLSYGMRFTVFSFDLHNSNIPLKADYPVLIKNLVENSLASIVSGKSIDAGQTVEFMPLPYSKASYLKYPDGKNTELGFAGGVCLMTLDKVGVYKATADYGEDIIREEYFFVRIPDGEMSHQAEKNLSLSLVPIVDKDESMARSPIWFIFAAIMLAFLLIEWGCYYYEQY